jgi:hypothetical protein
LSVAIFAASAIGIWAAVAAYSLVTAERTARHHLAALSRLGVDPRGYARFRQIDAALDVFFACLTAVLVFAPFPGGPDTPPRYGFALGVLLLRRFADLLFKYSPPMKAYAQAARLTRTRAI